MNLDSRIPGGPLSEKWSKQRNELKLVNPANKRKHTIIVVGTGLAGGAAAATLGELGYNVHVFTFHDSARRAHSIAAQGGINAAKNYQGDGDSVYRLFYDTVKGGDFRAREANVYRLAELSVNIIDQCVAQGVPFAREYGGYLANRSFGGAQVSRTFYARGQTGQQLLLGAYQALMRQVRAGTVKLFNRYEMLDVVVVNGRAVKSNRTQPMLSFWRPAATATFFISRRTPKRATSPPFGGRINAVRASPIHASPKFTRRACRPAANTSRSSL
jgi:succinate dehydrogenase / fumarate reductase flavoprotein subunit